MLHPQPATAADIPDLITLVQSAYRGEGSRAGWTTEADLLQGQRLDVSIAEEMLADPHGVVLLARDASGDPLGSVQLRDLGEDETGQRTAYFGLFTIAPSAQGSGLGSALMAQAEEFAASAWGAERMRMTVISLRTELIDYYLRRGYRRTGATEPFPYEDARFGTPKRDDLEFSVLVKDLRT